MALVADTRTVDGYPVYLPGDDAVAFLIEPGAMGGWVAVDADGVCGHVALHPPRSDVAATASRALGLEPGDLAVVARLLVGPARRRQGIGRRLLYWAWAEAASRERWPILDVMAEHGAAIGLYEDSGWRPIGTVEVRLAGGVVRTEMLYAAPTPHPPR